MTHEVLFNRRGTKAVVYVSGSNTTVTVAGDKSTSDLAVGDEYVEGGYLTQAVWGCDGGGSILIKRGDDLVSVYDSTGQQNYVGTGVMMLQGVVDPINVEFVGSDGAFIVFEVRKVMGERPIGPGTDSSMDFSDPDNSQYVMLLGGF